MFSYCQNSGQKIYAEINQDTKTKTKDYLSLMIRSKFKKLCKTLPKEPLKIKKV